MFIQGYELIHKITEKGQQLCSENEQRDREASNGTHLSPSISSLFFTTAITQMSGNIISGSPIMKILNSSSICLFFLIICFFASLLSCLQKDFINFIQLFYYIFHFLLYFLYKFYILKSLKMKTFKIN